MSHVGAPSRPGLAARLKPRLAPVAPLVAPRPILGIDPGLTGALCLWSPSVGEITVHDIPTLRIGKSKHVVDHYALARIVDAWAPQNPEVWIEFVSSSSQMGVSSAFNFGHTYGLLVGICSAHFLKLHFVTPNVWKTATKCKGDKDESLARAKAEFPRQCDLFKRKMDHGRADAALIALYGSRQNPAGRP